jgi:hypothetical protein
VQKAFGRLAFLDMRRNKWSDKVGSLLPWVSVPIDSTYDDRDLDSLLRGITNDRFKSTVLPSCQISMQVGNTYTASVYMNLVCLISQKGEDLVGKRVMVYSFGSGALATIFQITARRPTSARFTLQRMARTVNLMERLPERETVTPEELAEAIRIREKNVNRAGYIPQYSVSSLFPGTYYLEEVRSDFTREYKLKAKNAPRMKGFFYPIHASKVLTVEKIVSPTKLAGTPRVREVDLDISASATAAAMGARMASSPGSGSLVPRTTSRSFTFPAPGEGERECMLPPSDGEKSKLAGLVSPTSVGTPLKSPVPVMSQEETLRGLLMTSMTKRPGRSNAPIVISGVSAGLPGKDRAVFGADNLRSLVAGVNFIQPLSPETVQGLIDKNVVQVKKNRDGTMARLPVDSEERSIKLAAQLGTFDLAAYGVPDSLVSTMDTVVQVRVRITWYHILPQN